MSDHPPSLAPAARQGVPPHARGLNPPQLEAVLASDGPVLMLAGAGTGKTAALTARLAHLVVTRRARPGEILCVTFTNKAAREMKERVGALIGEAVEGMPWLGTFHAIGARMLRRHAELAGLGPNYTIIDTDDQLRLLKQLIAEQELDEKRWPARQLAALIDRWKNRGLNPGDLDAAENEAYANGKGRQFYELYQARLKSLNACDFGDLMLHMLNILRKHREVLEHYQQRFRYILVDEYQDTNAVQYLWLRLLAQARRNICVVGDDDQSIYSWRGAEVANILRFEKDFPGARIIRLEQNYRSTPHILGAASGLIAANRGRLGKTLWTQRNDGEKLRVIGVWDGPEEARLAGEEIARLKARGAPLDQVAILVRAQYQTREFEDRFIEAGIPYRIIGGFRFYERAEIRDALAYLRVIAQPADALAFERICNQPRRGLGAGALAAMHRHARASGLPLPAAALELAAGDDLPRRAAAAIAGLMQQFLRWRDLAGQIAPSGLLRTVLEESGYEAMLRAERSVEAAGRLENLSELARAMEDYATLEEFLEHVALVMDNDAAEEGAKATIMTMHAAKGLEFDHVFLPGWEEGVFPSPRALEEGGLASLEEERRLAYVAITRARLGCTILHAANRRIYGQWVSSLPSRFIAELPEAHVEHATTIAGGAEGLWQPHRHERASPTAPFLAPPARRHPERGARGTADRPHERPRAGIAPGTRVFHDRFGYGEVIGQEGNRLEIAFETAGRKRVIDSFVEPAE